MASTAVVYDILARDRASDKFDRLGKAASGSSKSVSKFSGIMKSAGKAAVLGIGSAATAAGVFAVASVKAASDAQQSLGATETVFGRFSKKVIADSNSAAKQFGLSANEYRENANLLGSLFKNQGVGIDELAGKTKGMIGTASDLAATFGGSTKEAVEALGSAFKGEFDPLERYGISLKQSTVNTEAMRIANVKSTADFEKLSVAQQTAFKQQAASNIIAKQSADAQGAFARETDTLAHKQQVLGAQFDNVKVMIGNAFLPILTKAFGYVSDTVIPVVRRFVIEMKTGEGAGGQFADAMRRVWGATQAAGAVILKVAGFLKQHRNAAAALTGAIVALVVVTKIHSAVLAVQAAGGLAAYLRGTKLVSAAIRTWTAIQWALNAALISNPIGITVVAVAALAAAVVIAWKRSSTFRSVVLSLWGALKSVAGFVRGAAVSAFNAMSGAVGSVIGYFDNLIGKVQSLIGWIGKIHVPHINIPGPFGRAIFKGGGKPAPGEAFSGSSIFGTDLSVEEGEAPKTIQAILAAGAAERAKAQQFATDVSTLLGKGLSKNLVRQLQESGEAGAEQIHLLAGGTLEQIRQANADNAAAQAALKAASLAVGEELSGVNDPKAPGGKMKLEDRIIKALDKWADNHDKNTVIKLDSRDIRAAIVRDIRFAGTR